MEPQSATASGRGQVLHGKPRHGCEFALRADHATAADAERTIDIEHHDEEPNTKVLPATSPSPPVPAAAGCAQIEVRR